MGARRRPAFLSLAARAHARASLLAECARFHARRKNTMAPSCPALLRLRESHEEAIYAIAFNQVDASLATVFATVGANRVTIYRIEDEEAEETAAAVASASGAAEAGAAATDANAPRKRFRSGLATRSLRTLQAYRDEDDDESFYCLAWGLEVGGANGGNEGTAGCLLAVAGAQRHVKLLDCCTGDVRAVLQGHGGAINEVRFHPRERALLLSASADESIRLWHVGTRECLATFLGDEGHRDAVVSIDIQHDGSAFASGSIDGTVKVWSLSGGKMQARVAEASREHAATMTEAAAAAAAAAQDANQEGVAALVDDVSGGAAAAAAVTAFAPAGEAPPAGASASKRPPRHTLVCQFPVATYEKVHYDAGAQLSYWVDVVRFVGPLLLTRGSDGRTLLWDPAAAEPVAAAAGTGGEAAGGGGGGAGASTAAARDDGEARPRLVPSASLAFRIGGTAGIWYLRFALDPLLRRLALGNTRGEVCVWNLEKAQLTPIVREGPSPPPEAAAAPSADADADADADAAAAAAAGSAASAAAAGDACARAVPVVGGGTNGARVVPPFAALRVTLEECLADGKKAKKGGSKKSAVIAAEDQLTVRSTAVSHDGKYVVGGCDEGSIVLWELAA